MKYHVLLSALLIPLATALAPAAHADIYKCTDEHGNVAYLQTPCPVERVEEAPAPDEEDVPTVEALTDDELLASYPEPQSTEAQVPSSRQPGEALDECKKRYREQIDEIDAEMKAVFSTEQGDAYKERLLALTKLLRACR